MPQKMPQKAIKGAKRKEKMSLIVILPYKNAFISFTKTVTFAKHIEVITEKKVSKIAGTRTRRVNLLARFKY